MKEISCNIIEDLLPLYYDNVCSEESRRLVEDHLSGCVQCREMLTTIKSEVEVPLVMDEAETIKRIAKKWKADKVTSFLQGGCVVSFLASVVCFFIFTIKGSYVAPDGTLIEAFGYIPIGFLFAFIGICFGVILAVRALIRCFAIKHKKRTSDR